MQIKIYKYEKYVSINIENTDIDLIKLKRKIEKSVKITRDPEEYSGRLEFSCKSSFATAIIDYIMRKYF